MGYWKTRVVPTMKKLLHMSPTKKAVVAETSKTLTFDDSKEAINKDIEEKKTELASKVVEIYEATSAELKALVREPKEDGLTKHAAEVHKFLEALVEIGFPGSKAACETSSTSFGQVTFIFEKVCVFLSVEKSREIEIVEEVVKTKEPAKEDEIKPAKEEETKSGEKEIEIVEEKKEEVKPAPVPVPAVAEEKKPAVVEEKKVAVEEKKPAVVEEKKVAVEEKKLTVEEKKPVVEEVKKEVVTPAPVAETPVKAPVAETPVKAPVAETPAKAPVAETPAKAPETAAALPQKA